MQTLWQDLRYGARMLLKQPGFTLTAVFTLALGIGLNAALFSVVNALILRPLPYHEADRLVQLWQQDRSQGVAETPVSNADFLVWRAQARSFASLTAHNVRPAALSTGEGAVEVAGVFGVCPTCLTGFPANALRIGSLAAFSGDPPSATKYGINLCECRF